MQADTEGMFCHGAGLPRHRRTDHERHKHNTGRAAGRGPKHHGMDSLHGDKEPPGTFLTQVHSRASRIRVQD